jgi:type I restriction enzyme S subunit
LAQSKLWDKGTLCITIAANIADTGVLAFPACFPDSIMGFVPFEGVANTRFIKYCFDRLQRDCKQISQGTAQDNLSWEKLSTIKFCIPEYKEQCRIADILSAYDDLIENNQKQIKLLEEAAQRLYKEWFVDLRFPGHENTKIVDDVPEGWSRTNINEILTFHRGYDLTKNEMKAGRYPVVGSTTVIGYHNEFKIKGPGIVTGRSGSLGKYQFIWDNFWPHNTSLYISDYKDHNIFFVYSLLQTVDFASLNNGGAIPTLNRNVLSNIEVIEPEKKLQDVFAKIAEPQYQKIRNLEKQNDRLKTARDLLLPKLMSGEVEV